MAKTTTNEPTVCNNLKAFIPIAPTFDCHNVTPFDVTISNTNASLNICIINRSSFSSNPVFFSSYTHTFFQVDLAREVGPQQNDDRNGQNRNTAVKRCACNTIEERTNHSRRFAEEAKESKEFRCPCFWNEHGEHRTCLSSCCTHCNTNKQSKDDPLK